MVKDRYRFSYTDGKWHKIYRINRYIAHSYGFVNADGSLIFYKTPINSPLAKALMNQ